MEASTSEEASDINISQMSVLLNPLSCRLSLGISAPAISLGAWMLQSHMKLQVSSRHLRAALSTKVHKVAFKEFRIIKQVTLSCI